MSNIIEITDFNAPELDVYARISEIQLLNRAEPEKGIFIAESPKVIERALDSGCKPISFLVEHKHIEGEAKELIRRCGDISVYTAEFDVLTQLTGFKLTRGMLCAMHRPALPGIDEICKNARRIAVLENVVNPTNIGDFSFCGGSWNGCGPVNARMQQSPVPPCDPCQHGNCISDPMDVF